MVTICTCHVVLEYLIHGNVRPVQAKVKNHVAKHSILFFTNHVGVLNNSMQLS